MSSGDYRQAEARLSAAAEWLVGPRFRGQQHAVSEMLKEAFDGIAAEPLPGRIVDLLRQLDAGQSAEIAPALAGPASTARNGAR